MYKKKYYILGLFMCTTFLISCTKEKEIFDTFNLSIDGTNFQPKSTCTKYVSVNDTIYTIIGSNFDTPESFLFEIPYSNREGHFTEKKFNFELATLGTDNKVISYNLYKGFVNINSSNKEYLEGEFKFIVVDRDTTNSDSLSLQGNFKLTLNSAVSNW